MAWQNDSAVPRTQPPRRSLGKRVRDMTLLWLGFGALVGAVTSAGDGGIVGALSGAVAGMILLPWIGVVLGLLGGPIRETLVGGVFGLAVGVVGGLLTQEAFSFSQAGVGLLTGAFIGATFLALFRRLVQMLRGWTAAPS